MTGKATFKYLGLAAITLWLGCAVAYITFAIMFNTPTVHLLPEILLPAGILAVVSLLAGLIAPLQARSLALVTAFPSVAVSIILTLMVALEGKFELGWVVVAIAAVAICLAAAQLACSVRKRGA